MIFLIIFISTLSYSQSERSIDSLVHWSYEKLFQKVEQSKTSEEGLIYSKAYLKKAKSERDTIKIANAFTQIITLSDEKTALNYCDSIINYTINSPNVDYPGWGYLYKGSAFLIQGKYEEAFKNASEAYKAALIFKNDAHIFYLNQEIGQLKVFWGDPQEAIDIYKNQLKIISLNKETFTPTNKLSSLFSLTNAYIIQKKLDSAVFFNNQGLKLSLISNRLFYPSFLHQSGEILFYENNFTQAKDSLLKSLEVDQSELKSANTYNILGQIASESKDTLQAIEFFLKADEILDKTNDFTPETKIIHSFLKDYYLVNGDLKNFKVYTDKLQKTDSALTENYKLVNRKLIEDFEIPKLILEKNNAIDIFEGKPIYVEYKNKVLVLITSILIITAFIYVQRKRLFPNKEEEPLEEEQEEEEEEEKENQNLIEEDPLKDINPEIIAKILKQLENFEKRKTFKNKRYNLKSLARKFQTNSHYLSRVINVKKGKNISTYLSDLRINYCINELTTNKEYYNYDVRSLASEFGFNSVGSFSKAFSAKTGITPAAYIKKYR